MTQEDIGKNDMMSFKETLNVVHCLQYDSYDTHEEITQVTIVTTLCTNH